MRNIFLLVSFLSIFFLSSLVMAVDTATNLSITPIAVPSTVEIVGAALTTTAVPKATPEMEGALPNASEMDLYESPDEPEPTVEEASKAIQKKSEARMKKHFTIEQTLSTPSSMGTKLGYFINENWRVAAEYSTISWLLANKNHEKNSSWAISGNYSAADDDWAPFYGVGFTMMDLYYSDKVSNADTGIDDNVKFTKEFTGGYLTGGVTWITDSILMASIEFDLYAGRTRLKKDNITTPSKSEDNKNNPTSTLSVMIGATVGICF
ncbi:MAG: hypothetical protein WCJ94_00490 [bacterium]